MATLLGKEKLEEVDYLAMHDILGVFCFSGDMIAARLLLHTISQRMAEGEWGERAGQFVRTLLQAGHVDEAVDCASQLYVNAPEWEQPIVAQQCMDSFLDHGPSHCEYMAQSGEQPTVIALLRCLDPSDKSEHPLDNFAGMLQHNARAKRTQHPLMSDGTLTFL